MTRREEIEKAANEFYKGDEVSTFVVAAQWADRTMIDKAIQWLFENVYDYLNPEDQEKVESFRKAMKE